MKPNILYSILLNLCDVYQNTKNKENDIKLLLFLLINRWGIKLESATENYFGKITSYLIMLKQCLQGIESNETNIFLSMIVLRRILPLILYLFKQCEYYIKNLNENSAELSMFFEKEFKFLKIDKIIVFSYSRENIFSYLKKMNISEKKILDVLNIIKKYFICLKNIIDKFSLAGDYYNEIFKQIATNYIRKENKKTNFEGKGTFIKPKKEEIKEEQETNKTNDSNKNNNIESSEKENKINFTDQICEKKINNYIEFLLTEKKEQNDKKDSSKVYNDKKNNVGDIKKLKANLIKIMTSSKIFREILMKINQLQINGTFKFDKFDIEYLKKKIYEIYIKNLYEEKGLKNKDMLNIHIDQEIYIENIVTFLDNVFYKNSINKLMKEKTKYSEIYNILESDYELKKELLNFELNEYYHLFEIALFCTYLTLIELCENKKLNIPKKNKQIFKNEEKINKINKNFIEEKKNKEQKKKEEINLKFEEIKAEIFNFILSYEEKSLYINFIEAEGHKSHIKKIYNELFINTDEFGKDYMSTTELRKYLLKKQVYQSNISEDETLEIRKKEIKLNGDYAKNKIKYDNLLKNNYKLNKNFYKGNIETQKFYEKVNFDIEINSEKIKIYEDYVDNFMKLNDI